MKKGILLIVALMVFGGCADISWQTKMQTGYFDKDGNRAGLSGSWSCISQSLKEAYPNALERQVRTCSGSPVCKELAETCMKEKGYIEAKSFETTEERMALYRKAYEEGWIKPGMTRLEVVSLLGAPQIATIQLIPPRKVWIYCRSAAKTAFVGFNFIFQIIWNEDKVESVDRHFKI